MATTKTEIRDRRNQVLKTGDIVRIKDLTLTDKKHNINPSMAKVNETIEVGLIIDGRSFFDADSDYCYHAGDVVKVLDEPFRYKEIVITGSFGKMVLKNPHINIDSETIYIDTQTS